jgi:succinate dehydrogenase / fumarate reductase flavoprotein subunit
MERYAPTIKDLAPRDLASRAIYTEIRQGRGAGPDGDYVYLDVSHLDPKVIDAKLPDITEFARTYLGVEPKKEGVPVQPTAHYAMGGIPTNVHGEVLADAAGTVVPGLYAAASAPACQCTAPTGWGPTRCSTSSCSAGAPASAPPSTPPGSTSPSCPTTPAADARRSLEELASHRPGERAASIRADLQLAMDDRAGVYRTDALLKEMEEHLEELRRRYQRVWVQDTSRSYNTDLLETVELGFLLDLAEALVVLARARTESRGGHFREDFPRRDDATWLLHTLAWKGDGSSSTTSR